MTSDKDFARLDDSALLRWRAWMRAELGRLPSTSVTYAAMTALYDRSTLEVNDRVLTAWSLARKDYS